MEGTSQHALRLGTLGLLAVLIGGGLTAGEAEGIPWEPEGRVEGADTESGWGFGHSVAVHGERVVVGAESALVGGVAAGAAYVFLRLNGEWVEEAKLEVAEGQDDDEIGWSVAVYGDCAIAGTRSGDVGSEQARGAAYVFCRTEDGRWERGQTILASDGNEQDWFGTAMATDGRRLVVGAPRKEIGSQQQGAAYVFELQDGEWVEEAKLFDPGAQVSDAFGYSVALDGDTILVGAYAANVNGELNRGATYVYRRSAGVWVLEQRLLASDGTGVDQFGWSVALDGDQALVGARHKPINGQPIHGAAYFFERSAEGVWTETQRVLPTHGGAVEEFGRSASLDGDLALIGAESDSTHRFRNGVVYEFRREQGFWVEAQRILQPSSISFGRVIALDGERLIVGETAFGNRGAAWIFRRPPLFADGFESGDTSGWSATIP